MIMPTIEEALRLYDFVQSSPRTDREKDTVTEVATTYVNLALAANGARKLEINIQIAADPSVQCVDPEDVVDALQRYCRTLGDQHEFPPQGSGAIYAVDGNDCGWWQLKPMTAGHIRTSATLAEHADEEKMAKFGRVVVQLLDGKDAGSDTIGWIADAAAQLGIEINDPREP